jgi:predicted HAD superfamily Cof-like phosphohydrolase
MDSAATEAAPTQYQIDKLSILYTALILEETAELTKGMSTIIARLSEVDRNNKDRKEQFVCKDRLASIMAVVDDFLTETSLEIREILKETEEFKEVLTKDEAIEVADAATDIVVVTAGYAISSGLPGAACYDEVVGSNLSKRNPATGKIDKDASGKWIKGIEYRAPNLEKVLFPSDSNQA